jgi:dipeptidyl-peptidase-4
MRYKYPKAGEKNSVVSAQLYRLIRKKVKNKFRFFQKLLYSECIQTAKPDEMVLITSERIQNASDILKVNTKTGAVQNLFTETDEKWIDTDSPTLNSWMTILSFGHLKETETVIYWYDKDGKLKKQVTKETGK